MAPNKRPDVRSDSWLDLSSSASLLESQLRRESRVNIPAPASRLDRQMSEDIATTNGHYRPSAPEFGWHRHSISDSNGRQHQHLLIRLRQQSYLRSNTSTNTSLSNFSASIELGDELQRAESPSTNRLSRADELEDKQQDADLDSRAYSGHAQVQQVVRGFRLGESSRLRAIKLRLGGAKRALPRGVDPPASPFTRSWSSFSAHLSDKLTNFRHSWKHFLYNYNQRRAQQEPWPARKLDWDALDRRELTNDWIRRHHGVQVDQNR